MLILQTSNGIYSNMLIPCSVSYPPLSMPTVKGLYHTTIPDQERSNVKKARLSNRGTYHATRLKSTKHLSYQGFDLHMQSPEPSLKVTRFTEKQKHKRIEVITFCNTVHPVSHPMLPETLRQVSLPADCA